MLKKSQRYEKRSHGDCATIICGDHNASAYSSVYWLLANGHLPEHFHDPVFNVEVCQQAINHGYKFLSAQSAGAQQEPIATFVTPHVRSTIDFIWFSRPALNLVKAIPVFKDAQEQQCVLNQLFLPNINSPSDHLSVSAIFSLEQPPSKDNIASVAASATDTTATTQQSTSTTINSSSSSTTTSNSQSDSSKFSDSK